MKSVALHRILILGLVGFGVALIGSGCGSSAADSSAPAAAAPAAPPASVPAAAKDGRAKAQSAAKVEGDLRSQQAAAQQGKP